MTELVQKEFGMEPELPLWELPSRPEFGDFSSAIAMRMASKVKQPPLQIAGQIKTSLENLLKDDAEKIEVLPPGYINIFVSRHTLIDFLDELLRKKDAFFRHCFNKKILLEFVSANPTGPLSIAHGRQAVVGDVIGNVLEFFGNQVTREYYINDAGRQLDLLVESVKERMKELNGQPFCIPEGGYQGEYVKEIAKRCLEKSNADIKQFILSDVMAIIKSSLDCLGIKFDTWRSQQKMIEEGKIAKIMQVLKEKSLIYEKERAWWFASTRFDDDKDRVVVKADGELTYFASDIAYHWEKIQRSYNQLINIWGPDHHGYIGRVKASLAALGYKKDILEVIIMQLVTIKSGERMSKRKGTMVLLSDLVNDLGKDTVRFYYLTRKNSSHLDFDIDLAKKTSFDNPLYYIQYACARIESIFKKVNFSGEDVQYSRFLKEKEEIDLLRMLGQFFCCLEKTYYTKEPVFIIEYLKNTAAVLHKFYEIRRVAGEEDNIARARLNLLQATKVVIHCALNLLGITPVEKM